jgi:hypothetical protein
MATEERAARAETEAMNFILDKAKMDCFLSECSTFGVVVLRNESCR